MANLFAKQAASVEAGAADAFPAVLVRLTDGQLIPDDASVTLSLDDALAAPGNAPLAVQLEPGDDARKLKPVIGRVTRVAVAFPSFRDGRGYSSARILRDELGFTGELRATGDVLIDQLVFMKRCGFDVVALRRADDVDLVGPTLARFADVYQPASDAAVPVWRRRR